jgi:L-seryl-tRNA(Ser) seleniumtransferase
MSQIGSGALPVATLASAGVRIEAEVARGERNRMIIRVQEALRRLPLPVVGRLDDRGLLLDCRCLEDEKSVLEELARLELGA